MITEFHAELNDLIADDSGGGVWPEIQEIFRFNTSVKNNWLNAVEQINKLGGTAPPYVIIEREEGHEGRIRSADAYTQEFWVHIWFFTTEGSSGTLSSPLQIDNYVSAKLETLANALKFRHFSTFQVIADPYINTSRMNEVNREMNKPDMFAFAGCVTIGAQMGVLREDS